MSGDNNLITQFCAITNESSAQIAENYLIAHDFDLERAVDFYIDHPPPETGNLEPAAFHDVPQAAADFPVAPPNVLEIPDDDEDEDAGINALAWQRASALAARQEAEQQMDDMMAASEYMIRRPGGETELLAVQGHSLGAGPGNRRRRWAPYAGPAGLADMDADDADAEAVAAAMMSAGAGEQHGSYHRRQQQQMLDHYHQLAQQQNAAGFQHTAPVLPAAGGRMQEDIDGEAAAAVDIGVRAGPGNASLHLPEGINLEEARMLEAAMLGVPYQGRIPDFQAAAAAGPPLSPGAMEQRSLRAEQDLAYEESLALDRAKQESIAAAQAAAEAQDRAEQEAAAAEAKADAEAKQALAALLDTKRQRLAATPEPAAGEPGSFTVMVRLPDGSRKGRRCQRDDLLQTLFDFVDVQCCSSGVGTDDGSETGCGGLKPGAYRLVTQFPRRVYVETSGERLQDAGITTDSALFVELI